MLNLRYPWIWVGVGWLLVIGVVVGSLVPGPGLPTVSMSDKLMHAGVLFPVDDLVRGLVQPPTPHVGSRSCLLLLGVALDSLQADDEDAHFDCTTWPRTVSAYWSVYDCRVWLLEGWCQRMERRLLAGGLSAAALHGRFEPAAGIDQSYMLDPKVLRQDLDAVVANLARRGFVLDRDRYLALEAERKELQVRGRGAAARPATSARRTSAARRQPAATSKR